MLKVNDHIVAPTIFPDGTSQVWKIPDFSDAKSVTVTWIFEHEAELIHLAQLRELLPWHAKLWMPYLPYGRQDKKIRNDATFALAVFADHLNVMLWNGISTFDPHSPRAEELIKHLLVVSADSLISQIAAGFDYVCFPDAGAAERYNIDHCQPIYCAKVRDQATGNIVRYEISNGDAVQMGASVLVVDDICDGGATFILLGNMLKCYRLSASLYVSHGIFSKGIESLKSYYDRIITTDSRPTKHKELTVYESATSHRLLQG